MSETNKIKSYQIKMDCNVHVLLKKRAKYLEMTIGEFIQNMFASFELRVSDYKEQMGFNINQKNDELDARLLKILLLKDGNVLNDEEVNAKLQNILMEFQHSAYRPSITIKDDNGK